MRDDTVRILARVNKYLYLTLMEGGHDVSVTRLGKYQAQPGLGFVEMRQEVARSGLMTPEVASMVASLIADMDEDDFSVHERLPVLKQGPYTLEWVHQIDFEIISVKEAADALGVSTQRVYKLLQGGKLRGVRYRGQRMVFAFSVKDRDARSKRIGRQTPKSARTAR